MHTLTLVDTPNSSGTSRSYEYVFPGSWEELSIHQLGQVLLLRGSGLTEARFFPRLLRTLAGIPARLAARMRIDDLLSCPQPGTVLLIEQLHWATTDPVFSRSLLPTLTVGGRVWQGPKAQLKNFSLLQFSLMDHCVEVLRTARSEEALHNALGAAYHPADEPWHNEGVEARGRMLATLPLTTKLAAVFNYQAVRASLPAHFPRTFSKQHPDDAHAIDFGVDGLIEAMAGDKFGDVDQAGHKRLTYALINSERAIISMDRMKREFETTGTR